MKYEIYLSISEGETKKELASFGAVLDTEQPYVNINILQLAFMLAESYIQSDEEYQWVKIRKG